MRNTVQLDFKILDERLRVHMPGYATAGSAGLDLRACLQAPLTLAPGRWELVATGMAIHLKDPGCAALILANFPLSDWQAMLAALLLLGLGFDALLAALKARPSLLSRIGPLP